MTRRYRDPLEDVRVDGGAPTSFRWRGRRYRVVRVLGHWREEEGWWRRADGAPVRIEQADLWRLEAVNGSRSRGRRGGVYEVARRAGIWRLDRVWD